MISNEAVRKHYLKYPWNRVYRNIYDRCNNPKLGNYKRYGGKGIKCLIAKEELKKLWFRDKAYKMVKPSIDRKNSKKDYIYNNCQFLEFSENCCKESKIPILQFTVYNTFVRRWKSIGQASRFLGIDRSNIGRCVKNQRQTAGGYKWLLER